ncbi:hypothetical protein BH11PLA2_BH11PLA2_03650 [soil metagenome]
MNKDLLKKHHFWVVALVSLLLAFLAFIFLSSDVSGAIEAKETTIKTAQTKTSSVKAPGVVALKAIEEQKKTLEKKKDELWKANWDAQKAFYTWPKTADRMFDSFNDLKFGDPIKGFGQDFTDVFRKDSVFKAMYEELAANVAPTKFLGGWQAVLGERYFTNWGEKVPEQRQLWLVMEDVWVQRALLEPIRQVDDTAAQFTKLEPAASPLKRSFANRVWQIDLDVVDQAPNKVMKGKLRNLTKQMQLLGSASTMVLKVWLDPNKDLPPFEFKIEGEYVKGESEFNVSALQSHVIPPGTTVTEIFKVEQVLDDRTVPIRQINAISLKKLSAKEFRPNADQALLPPEFWKDDPNAPAVGPAGGPAAPAAPAGRGGAVGGGDGRPLLPGAVGFGAPPTPAAGGTAGGTMDITGAVDNNRKRYVEVTGQLRRMPVAIQVVCDLRYMQDLMVAYANSPLRFQIVQYHWSRYRGALQSDTAPGSSGSPGSSAASDAAPVAVNGSLGDGLGPRGSEGPRGGDGPRGGGDRPLPTIGPMPSTGAAGPREGFIPGLVGGQLTSVSEAQANSALIELTIYGIVTLYEKHEVKKDAAANAVPATTPTTTTPTADTPTVTTPETPKKDAPTTGTETPKVEAPKTPAEPAPKETPKEAPKPPTDTRPKE